MSKLRERAVNILQDIPEDKLIHVIELLKGLQGLYGQSYSLPEQEVTPASLMGIFSKYANPALIPLEKDAWGEAVKEKHGVN